MMLARFRENLLFKIISLALAISLHSYVAAQQTPARSVTVPLSTRGLPPKTLVDPAAPLPTQVTVALDGPSDTVAHLSPDDVTATLDLSRARAGQAVRLPVLIRTPEGVRGDPTPDAIPVTLLDRQVRRMSVTAGDPGAAPVGFRFDAPALSPRMAEVAGPSESVKSVSRLVARIDAPDVGTVEGDYPIVALDSGGAQVADVSVTPAQAHVVIRMVRVPAMKTLLVSPTITGAPTLPARITGIEISPASLIVSGRPDRLTQISTLKTLPVDVTNATGDVTRTVLCETPPGVHFSGPASVTVTVHIAAGSSPAPPAPGPAAPVAAAPAHP